MSILVAVDPSGCAHEVVNVAAKLAADLGDDVVLCTSTEIPEGVTSSTPLVTGPYAGKTALEALQADGLAALDALASAFHSVEVAVQTVVLIGKPVDAVLAESHRADYRMLVLGTHGRTGLKRLFLGSVAEQIIRHADLPVLTIKTEQGDELHPSAIQTQVRSMADG